MGAIKITQTETIKRIKSKIIEKLAEQHKKGMTENEVNLLYPGLDKKTIRAAIDELIEEKKAEELL